MDRECRNGEVTLTAMFLISLFRMGLMKSGQGGLFHVVLASRNIRSNEHGHSVNLMDGVQQHEHAATFTHRQVHQNGCANDPLSLLKSSAAWKLFEDRQETVDRSR